jgi:spore coat polysaccharide biosynthesis protein SpsF
MKVTAIIQARMGSTRLPGKVLMDIAGRPLLEHVIERVLACRSLDQVVIATTNAAEDDKITDFVQTMGISFYRGSTDDVLDRYYQAAKIFNANILVRLTADCPLLDPIEIDRIVSYFLNHNELDYIATGHTYPEGYGAEVFTMATLERAWREAKLVSEREHVTPYIWKGTNGFRIQRLEFPQDLSWIRATVDEECDLEVISFLIKSLSPHNLFFGINDVAEFLKIHPEVASINSNIARMKGYFESVINDKIVKDS